MMDLRTCIEKGFLVRSRPDRELSEKEMKESKYDLAQAKKSFKDKDYKWAIVKCYYSMFHASKSILYSLGYIEKKHIAVLVVLESLNKEGKIESRFINEFKAAMTSREEADYRYSYSEETARIEIDSCKEFIDMAYSCSNDLKPQYL